ncbi:MAG: tetratricopeptide repeat protein [Bacteroidota bacterium]
MISIFKYSFLLIYFMGIFAFADVYAQNNQQVILSRQQQNRGNPKEKLAIKFYRDKEFDKAAELFQQLYKSKPSNYYYTYYFNSLIEIKNYRQAERLVKQQKKLNQNNFRYLIDEAYVANLSGNKKKATKVLNKVMNNLPTDRNQIIQITSSLQSKGYTDMAVKVFQKATQMQGNNNSYNFEIANAYFYSGDYSKMFDSYITQLEQHPADIQRIKTRLQYVMRIDVNNNLSGMLKTKLLLSSQQNPDNIQLAEMLLWYSLQTKDFTMAYRQAKAIDRRFGNRDLDMLELADIAMSNYDYQASALAYEYVKNKKNDSPYFTESYVGYYLSIAKQVEENPNTVSEDYKELEKLGIRAISILGVNNLTSSIVESVADITAFRLGNNSQAISMLVDAIEVHGIDPINKASLKLKLADILLSTGHIWDATLLYSQVETDMKSEPIGHEAKLKNAKVFYYVGEFDWANTRLDILKSATSKLISNDAIELSLFIDNMREEDTIGFILRKFAKADLYTYQRKYDSAMILLNKIEDDPAGMFSMEYTLYNKANIYFKLNDFNKADSVYNKLISYYPKSIKADNALFERAELQRTRLNNNEEALNLYLILMTDYPESIYAGKARKNYRILVEE